MIEPRQDTQTYVNDSETSSRTSTGLAREGSRPVRGAELYILRDKDDKLWGPFEDHAKAIAWAEKKWPDVPSYHDCDGMGAFWDIEAIYPAT